MSISEVVAMYESQELEVHPEFQRIFRWTLEQQSRLIESVFLGIPVPPIFVAQRKDGVWDVIDGVQRLSTLLRFMGVLKDAEDRPDHPEPLTSGDYLGAMRGLMWAHDGGTEPKEPLSFELTDAQRRIFKRSRLDFQIVQKDSDEQAKFDLFQRLNSGTRLSEQEARNCLAVMLDSTFSTWLQDLADNQDYENTVDISDRKEQESYDVESALRYLACTLTPLPALRSMGDVGEFLTTKMRHFIADGNFDRKAERARFDFVFSTINNALGDRAFKRYDPNRNKYVGRFSISAFETIACGLARNYEAWLTLDPAERGDRVESAVKAVWSDPVFAQRSGGGKPANQRIVYMVEVGERIFADHAAQ